MCFAAQASPGLLSLRGPRDGGPLLSDQTAQISKRSEPGTLAVFKAGVCLGTAPLRWVS
jgi:hypothetical protein